MSEQQPYNHETSLMEGFRAGNQQAFTTIYAELYERLYWFGRKYIDEKAEVEDIATEAFLQLWQRRAEFETFSSVSAFLHVVIRNQCFTLLKRRQMQESKQQVLLDLLESQEPGDFYIEQLRIELFQKIFAEVDKLPVKMKEIFLLSYQEGLKPAEIAAKLQLNVQTVSNQKINAIKVLKLALGHQPLLVTLLTLLEMEAQVVQ